MDKELFKKRRGEIILRIIEEEKDHADAQKAHYAAIEKLQNLRGQLVEMDYWIANTP